jgi:uncharacterized protein
MKKLLLGMIGFYQRRISPAFGARCRFHPSCSNYAREAIKTHGALKGFCLALWRLLRCQPLCKGGYDPVPLRGEQGGRDEG